MTILRSFCWLWHFHSLWEKDPMPGYKIFFFLRSYCARKQTNKNGTAPGFKLKHFNLTSHHISWYKETQKYLAGQNQKCESNVFSVIPTSIIIEMFTFSPDIPRKISFSLFFFRASIFDKLVLTQWTTSQWNSKTTDGAYQRSNCPKALQAIASSFISQLHS